MKKRSMGDRIFDAIVYAILVVVFLIVFFPLMYVVSTSFASARELALNKFLIFPKHPTLEVYQYIFSTSTFLRSMIVTIVITVVGTLVNLVMTCLMAYPLSRKALPGRSVIMTAVTFTLVFSGGMIPMYLVVNSLRLIDTYTSLILPGAISSFNLILVKNFFQEIPESLMCHFSYAISVKCGSHANCLRKYSCLSCPGYPVKSFIPPIISRDTKSLYSRRIIS